jgi:phosphoribosylformimino-5-aminoimidazole carboxamide ribotide isomerase
MPIEVIPVLDLAAGAAVHAIGGDRSRYAPVTSVLAPRAPGDAIALARAYRQSVGARRCYVADLDAITGGVPQCELLARLASTDGFGHGLLVDAGIATAAELERLDGLPVTVVVGLETLRAWGDLPALLAAAPTLIFSLDLREGQPVVRTGAWQRGVPDAVSLAAALEAAGLRELILLDLARVGRDRGPDLALLGAVRAAAPGVRLLAGGGVRDAAGLARLAAVGVDGVLVASALHRGALAPGRGQSPSEVV